MTSREGDPGAPGTVRHLDHASLAEPRPQRQRLANGRYEVLLSNAGSGGSSCDGIALTRWQADPVEDGEGWFHYLRDLDSGRFWSAGYQPTGATPERYAVRLAAERVDIARDDDGIAATLQVAVAPRAPLEVRRCHLANRSGRPRRLEITSYLEAVLLAAAADAAHPAFAKLFVQTEAVPARRALLASRRPRGADERRIWLASWLITDGSAASAVDYETDRARFIGRGRSLAAPAALTGTSPLSGTVGNVLDPVLSLRTVLELPPAAESTLAFGLAFAASREEALDLVARHATLAQVGSILGTAPAGEAPAGAARATVRQARYRPAEAGEDRAPTPAAEALTFDNGFGGFAGDGREYVIRVTPAHRPPLPWTHVVANEGFGFIVSESGAGTTWSGNSRENRLTPWYNDPVCDPHGEALYLRDEDAGIFWSPTPGPVAAPAVGTVRYGFGWCRFEQTSAALEQQVGQFVPHRDPLKITRIRLVNRSERARRISLFSYARLVLGGLPPTAAGAVETWADERSGALLARNPERRDFADAVAFAAAVVPAGARIHRTADRAAFIGRNGSPARPAALLSQAVLDERTGGELDPCFALQVALELAPGETAEVAFLLGEGESRDVARALIARYGSWPAIEQAFDEIAGFWRTLTSSLQLRTAVPAIDLLFNGWLVYQTLCCRLWARSAFYQSGGAFGFRDQLQDAAALVHLRPELTRAQILLHAAHQFVEGDVLHWWHPPRSRGIRTRFSDDLLWLPLVTAHYVASTGDRAILDEEVRFLRARPLEDGEDEVFLEPEEADERASLYEHCCRALDRSLTKGPHGLPLIGTGDWNDGMNRVGRLGRGESVWLGFFLHLILGRFVPLCRERGEGERLAAYEEHRRHLERALNDAGWDGAWYRRAYYDDGTPLGAAAGDECTIDALVQAWAVISGVAPDERARQSLDAMERQLVDEESRLIRLLAPPFDRTTHDPGYIKGYVPGVRENGGQYTHAALWAIQALAEAGRCERAARLLEMLSPVSHARTPEAALVYRVEPYVVAADVYGAAPHVGRGGWTWYTGSAGWMFRLILETLLGFSPEGGTTLVLQPRLPAGWAKVELRWRLPDGATTYDVRLVNPSGRGGSLVAASLDGAPLDTSDGSARIPLWRDGQGHQLRLELG